MTVQEVHHPVHVVAEGVPTGVLQRGSGLGCQRVVQPVQVAPYRIVDHPHHGGVGALITGSLRVGAGD
jgi:hypothetical protein